MDSDNFSRNDIKNKGFNGAMEQQNNEGGGITRAEGRDQSF